MRLLEVARDILWTTLTLAESAVEVITLLEIDVLEEVADNGPYGMEFPHRSMLGLCEIVPSTGMGGLLR